MKKTKTARAIIVQDGKLLVFFRRKIIDLEEVTYFAIPGGHVEEGEDCEETVVRELKEEMNVDIEILDYLGKLVIDKVEEYYYQCKIVSGEILFGGEEKIRCNENNYYEIRWVAIDELNSDLVRVYDLVRKVVDR